VIKLLGVERLKRGSRVHFAVGGRVRTLLGAALAREAALTRVLTCAPEQHLASVERALEDAKSTSKAYRAVQRELATAIGAALPTEGVVRFHRDDADPAFLAAVADAVGADVPGLYTGDGVFLVAGPAAWVAAWGPRVATALDGRGGGAKGRFQGKCAGVAARETIVFE
jgi:alanyl-tRNA synthetase/misacylated tRNA(Ala) deacylase